MHCGDEISIILMLIIIILDRNKFIFMSLPRAQKFTDSMILRSVLLKRQDRQIWS